MIRFNFSTLIIFGILILFTGCEQQQSKMLDSRVYELEIANDSLTQVLTKYEEFIEDLKFQPALDYLTGPEYNRNDSQIVAISLVAVSKNISFKAVLGEYKESENSIDFTSLSDTLYPEPNGLYEGRILRKMKIIESPGLHKREVKVHYNIMENRYYEGLSTSFKVN
jgi:hypothetical protein